VGERHQSELQRLGDGARGGGMGEWSQEGSQGYLAELVEWLQDVMLQGDLELSQDFGQRALYEAAHLQGFPVWGQRRNDCRLEPCHPLTQHPPTIGQGAMVLN